MPGSLRVFPTRSRQLRSRWLDFHAASKLVELREERGLSQERLAAEIKRYAKEQGWFSAHGAVDAFTIRRIERDGHCPSERVRLVIALFFGLSPSDIWSPANRRRAA